jgi:tetratricopeptide (TPR) repeat protein
MSVTSIWAAPIKSGLPAPDFSLKNLQGTEHRLSDSSEVPMLVLYFFDVDSRPSQEGLLSLDKLAQRFAGTDLTVWGITGASRDEAAAFADRTSPGFPVLPDAGKVLDLYQARLILPTVCIIGPDQKVLDYYQGGGKTTEIMLVRLAERTLQRKQTLVAKAITDTVIEKNPDNVDARALKGYAELSDGNLAEAEEIFTAVSEDEKAGEVLGKEGLSAVYARKGDTDKALELADEVTRKAPERTYAHMVKADILYSQDKKTEAEAEYRKAAESETEAPYQKAVALNQFGRFYASLGNYDEARSLYDQAVDVDPYYVEAMSNKGMTYEKEGNWDQALSEYRQAVGLDSADTFASVLAQKAEEMIALQQDADRSREIDALVKDLAERFRKQKKKSKGTEDTWTSRPMILSFVDFQEKGNLSQRDGYSVVMTTQLADELNASGRVKVVERAVMDRLLSELNLGSSELADPDTALKLGQVLAAKIMATGTLLFTSGDTLLSLRLVDTETSAIAKVVTGTIDSKASLSTYLRQLNRELLKTIIEQYPLKGYLVQSTDDQVMLNIGKSQGVVQGTRFDVIEEQKPVEYKGKKLQAAPKTIGEIEVVSVEPDLCYARILSSERPLKQDDKAVEKIESSI